MSRSVEEPHELPDGVQVILAGEIFRKRYDVQGNNEYHESATGKAPFGFSTDTLKQNTFRDALLGAVEEAQKAVPLSRSRRLMEWLESRLIRQPKPTDSRRSIIIDPHVGTAEVSLNLDPTFYVMRYDRRFDQVTVDQAGARMRRTTSFTFHPNGETTVILSQQVKTPQR